jgi:predicted acylesterase/phospholipase RssA/ABC-type phosphate/phosphonate transport system substrate-binding protein
MKSLLVFLLFGVLALVPPSAMPAVQEKVNVRVGIVAFQDFQEGLDRYDRLFSDLERDSRGKLHFQLASGTYGDLLHWIDRGLVDVAVLSPGVFAEVMGSSAEGKGGGTCEYLATVGLKPPAGAGAGESPYLYQYRAACVVGDRSPLTDLRMFGKTVHGPMELMRYFRFLFVHPLSVSGRIAPEFALQQAGIRPQQEQIRYSYSHSNSLRSINQEKGWKEVAFVWENSLKTLPEKARVRRIDFPELDQLSIPSDAVVARRGFPYAARVAELLAAHRDARGVPDLERFADWESRYGVIRNWRTALSLPSESVDSRTVSLHEVSLILEHFARSQPVPPRLALVLSGGGAKCSYQVGVVAALEQELEALRKRVPAKGLDIALVVGTSGGAMNALPIALGISSTPQGQEDFRGVWTELDQREMIRPSEWLRSNIGLWWACFHALWIPWAVRRFVARPERRGWWMAVLLILLATVQLWFGYGHWQPWRLLGDNHALHHLWLLGYFGVRWSAWCLLGIGAIVAMSQWFLRRRGKCLLLASRLLPSVLIFALVSLPLAQILMALFHEETLSDGSGIEATLAQKYPRMIDGRLTCEGGRPLDLEARLSNSARLQTISRQIFDRRLLRRDLVLTGSCLSQTSTGLPSDLYFYAATDPSRSLPRYGGRGIPLRDRPSILMDVVMGSGSIFPVFPPRVIHDFPRPGERIELVDGGFSHNSPIEAAILWGATHVILVQASPQERIQRGNFLNNSAEAFNHLYNQAQLLDAKSKGQVVVFTLAPEAPHLCVIDFAENLVRASIEKGYREATGQSPLGAEQPRFRKELGEPIFWDAVAPRDGKGL